jgi:hypothetical protein
LSGFTGTVQAFKGDKQTTPHGLSLSLEFSCRRLRFVCVKRIK